MLLALLLAGCASPAFTLAQLGINAGSLAASGKTITDHLVSAARDMDCALLRVMSDQQYCQFNAGEDGIEIVYAEGAGEQPRGGARLALVAASYRGPFRNSCTPAREWRRALMTLDEDDLDRLPPACGTASTPGVVESGVEEVAATRPVETGRREEPIIDAYETSPESRALPVADETAQNQPAKNDSGDEADTETANLETAALTGNKSTIEVEHEVLEAGEYQYRLGPGDKLRVIVFGEDDLSGEFKVGSAGETSLPLIGAVRAGGLTIPEFEIAVAKKLLDGYLKKPRVSAEVLNYRTVSVLGEVKNPGRYEYVSGMTVLQAVAIAGGYSYRANEKKVKIIRHARVPEGGANSSSNVRVYPGDIVRIPERFF